MRLENLTWPSAGQALQEDRVVVIPIGSIEQHGPHLPVGTDYFVADRLGRLVAEKSDACIVMPTIPYGYAEYHTDFPGTVSTERSETLLRYLEELTRPLIRHGARRFLFVNAHGGNMTALNEVCYVLRNQGVFAATLLWWDVISRVRPEYSPAGHAEWIETSLVLGHDENLVDMDVASLPKARALGPRELSLVDPHTLEFRGVPLHIRLRTMDFSETGDMPEPNLTPGGDPTIPPTEASREIGETIYSEVSDYICALIPVLQRVDPDMFD